MAALLAGIMEGLTLDSATDAAIELTVESIERTGRRTDVRFGVNFEAGCDFACGCAREECIAVDFFRYNAYRRWLKLPAFLMRCITKSPASVAVLRGHTRCGNKKQLLI